jgi:hypothetical protein
LTALQLAREKYSMPIVGQQSNWLRVGGDGFRVFSDTVQVRNRDTYAEIAFMRLRNLGAQSSKCGISQIVSDSGVENWDLNLFAVENPARYRRNVTSITFTVITSRALLGARWMLHFWS